MRIANQTGFYLPFFAICLAAILGVMALGVDVGKLYIESLRQQRAADAGAVAAASRIGSGLSEAEIEQIGLTVAQDNFELNKVRYDQSKPQDHIRVDYDNANTVAVDTAAKYETLFTGKIIPGPKNSDVRGHAVGVRGPLHLTFVLDTTCSMKLLADESCSGKACPTKLDALKAATNAFIDLLDETRDRVAIVSFGNDARINYKLSQPFSKAAVHSVINSLDYICDTSIQNGVREGRNAASETDASGIPISGPGARRTMIVVTDGAPNTWTDYNTHADRAILPASCPFTDELRGSQLLSAIESDRTRSAGITVFTIGVGTKDPDRSTAFQNYWDDDSLKEVLLRRMANSSSQAAAVQGSFDPEYPIECGVPRYSSVADRPVGEYLAAPNATMISDAYSRLAKRLQMRLVE